MSDTALHLVPAMPVLSFRDIEFSYGQLQVLFGVSAEVQEGEAGNGAAHLHFG